MGLGERKLGKVVWCGRAGSGELRYLLKLIRDLRLSAAVCVEILWKRSQENFYDMFTHIRA